MRSDQFWQALKRLPQGNACVRSQQAVKSVDEEIVYVGICTKGRMRWWRYSRGELASIALPRGPSAQGVAFAILRDFAREAALGGPEDAQGLAADFARQFLLPAAGVQAHFIEGHRIRTWLSVLRMCGLVG